MSEIKLDFSKTLGKIKPMHGVGQPPMLHADLQHFHYLTEAGIPYSRLHDTAGIYGGCVYVDIPNIFRNFDADEFDPASYSFKFTDHLIKGLIDAGTMPVYRFGVTIENYSWKIESVRNHPPKDFAKWARICEHIIRHYNYGWADGFEYNIKYWEIWNEPEGYGNWTGTPEQYFELYNVASKHLKSCFGNKIMVGGYSSVGFMAVAYDPPSYGFTHLPKYKEQTVLSTTVIEYFHKFMKFAQENNCPIDFFSWHSYLSVPNTELMVDYCIQQLAHYGYDKCEVHINEWNNGARDLPRGCSTASARAMAMMLAMQNKPIDMLCYYDARIGTSIYGGMFNPLTFKPFCTYYAFKAFNELYQLGTQVECLSDTQYLYAVGALNGDKKAVVVTVLDQDREVISNMPSDMQAYLIDENNMLTKIQVNSQKFTIAKDQILLFKNY